MRVNSVRNIFCAAMTMFVFVTASLSQTTLAAGPPDYVIGPGDVLDIKVRNDPTLDSTVLVRPDGKITVQLISDVQAAGLTTMQLTDRIVAGLSKFYQSGAPSVTVFLLEMKSKTVYIEGRGIAKSGPVPLTGPLTIMQLIAVAGGLTEYAKGKEIKVIREEGGVMKAISFNYETFQSGKDLTQNIALRSGDIVDVP